MSAAPWCASRPAGDLVDRSVPQFAEFAEHSQRPRRTASLSVVAGEPNQGAGLHRPVFHTDESVEDGDRGVRARAPELQDLSLRKQRG